jgi:hypothetical protein
VGPLRSVRLAAPRAASPISLQDATVWNVTRDATQLAQVGPTLLARMLYLRLSGRFDPTLAASYTANAVVIATDGKGER